MIPYKCFPLSIVEAIRCGNVIITTDHNYLSDVISDQNGALVSPCDVEALAEQIIRFVDDKALLHSVQTHNVGEARSKYSEEAYLKSVSNILES